MTTATAWNTKHARGTKVKFYPQGLGRGTAVETETRGSAYYLSSGKSVVPLRGIDGAKPLAQVEIVQPPKSS
jgi:hypothetical protein